MKQQKEKINYRINHKNTMVMIPVYRRTKGIRLMCVVVAFKWCWIMQCLRVCAHIHNILQYTIYIDRILCVFVFLLPSYLYDSISFSKQKFWSSWEQNEQKGEGGCLRAYHSFWTNNNCYCCNRLSCLCCCYCRYWFVHSPNQNAGLNVMINYRGIPSWIVNTQIQNGIKSTSSSSSGIDYNQQQQNRSKICNFPPTSRYIP